MTAVGAAVLVLASLVPQAQAQEVPHGTIAYSTGKAVFVISADGSGKAKLYKKKGWSTCCPVVSPDGSMVLFLATQKSKPFKSALMVANLQGGGGVVTLAGKKFNPGFGAWSPDSSQVAFSAFSKKKKGVYLADADGGGRQRVYERSAFGTPVWNHDGMKVAFSDLKKLKARLWYHDLDTNELYRVPSDFSIDAYAPQWSPTEDVLLFFSLVDPEGDQSQTALYTVDALGQNLTLLTEEGESVVSADWSLDGQTITYNSCCGPDEADAIQQISPDGSGRTTIVTDDDAPGVMSSFELHGYSPLGTVIAYTNWDFDDDFNLLDSRLFTINADGSDPMERLADPTRSFMQWAPDGEAMLLCQGDPESGGQTLQYLLGEAVFDIVNHCDAHWGA